MQVIMCVCAGIFRIPISEQVIDEHVLTPNLFMQRALEWTLGNVGMVICMSQYAKQHPAGLGTTRVGLESWYHICTRGSRSIGARDFARAEYVDPVKPLLLVIPSQMFSSTERSMNRPQTLSGLRIPMCT